MATGATGGGKPPHCPIPYQAGAIGDGRTVLIVDDHDDTRQALTALLELEGYHVVPFANGRVALELIPLLGYRPDVAVIDLMMPSMDGFAFRDAMMNDERLRNVRLIALTGHTALQKHARDTGFDAAILKPCEPSMLLSLVSRQCRRRDELRRA